MQTYNSMDLLDALHAQTTAFLNQAIQQWQMMADKKFSLQPSPAQWSAKQCLAHLNSYGDYYLPAINNAISIAKEKGSKPEAMFSPGWLGNYFTQMMQTGADGMPAKKIKAFKKYVHPNDKDGDTVIACFIEQQEKTLLLIESAKDISLEKTRVGISIAPFVTLKLGDVFMFIAAHNDRHLKQAARAAGVTAVSNNNNAALSL